MRILLIFGMMLLGLLSCNKEIEKPKDLIPRKEMKSILKEIYLFKQVKNYRIEKDLPDFPKANLAILSEHNVTLEQFQNSYKYYIIDNAAYDKLLEEIKKEMKAELPPGALEKAKDDNNLPPSAQ